MKTTFCFPNFEDKGRTHVYHNKIKIELFRGNSVQASFSKVATDGTRPKFRYNRLGLFIYWVGVHCTVTQSCLAHCILQGVEHTSPTGWSDSHLSIGDKYVWLFDEQLLFSITCSIILYDNSVTYVSKTSVTLTTFQIHKIWLSTIYTFAVLRTARSH